MQATPATPNRPSPGAQAQIDATPSGDTLQLDIGEYQGPLVISKPMRIVGHGGQTVIWVKSGPAIVVMADDVYIENIQLEQTVTGDTALICYTDTAPQIQKLLTPNALENRIMNQTQLIQLDIVERNAQFSLPFILPTNTTMEMEAVDWCNVSTNQQRGIAQMLVKPPGRGMMFAQVKLVNHDTNQTQAYLLRGDIQPLEPIDGIVLKSGKRSIYFPTRLRLDDKALGIITESDSIKPGLYAIFQPSGVNSPHRTIWIPDNDLAYRVVYNDTPLDSWHRKLLATQDKFTVDKQFAFEVATGDFNSGALQFNRQTLDFGTCTRPTDKTIKLEINKGSGFLSAWKGQVTSLVDWITVDNSDIQIKRTESQATIDVKLNYDALQDLPNDTYDEPNALVIHGKEAIYFLPAQITVAFPDYDLSMVTHAEFLAQPTETFRIKALAGKSSSFELANRGRNPMQCKLKAQVDWLDIPTLVHIPPYESVKIEVTLNALANEQINTTSVQEEQAILVESQNHDQSIYVPVIIPAIDIALTPKLLPELKFPVERFNKYKPERLTGILSLKNVGEADGIYTINPDSSTIDIRFEHGAGNIKVGEVIKEKFYIPAEWLSQFDDDEQVQFHIVIEQGQAGQVIQLPITIEIVNHYPELVTSIRHLELQNQWHGLYEADSITVELENIGQADFAGRIDSTLDWLTITDTPNAIRIPAGDKLTFAVATKPAIAQLDLGNHSITDAIVVVTTADNTLMTQLDATVTILEPKPLLHLNKTTLFLGNVLSDSTIDESNIPDWLWVENYGKLDWVGTIQSHVDWIRVPFEQVTIPPETRLKLPVYFTRELENLPIGIHDIKQALTVTANDQTDQTDQTDHVDIRAMLHMVERRPVIEWTPESIDMGTVLLGASNSITNTVYLKNLGTLDWQIDRVNCPDCITYKTDVQDGVVPFDDDPVSFVFSFVSAVTWEAGQHQAEIEIIGTDDTEIVIPTEFVVEVPQIELVETSIHVHDYQSDHITIENQGGHTLRLHFDADASHIAQLIYPGQLELLIEDPSVIGLESQTLPSAIDIPPTTSVTFKVTRHSSQSGIAFGRLPDIELQIQNQEPQRCQVKLN